MYRFQRGSAPVAVCGPARRGMRRMLLNHPVPLLGTHLAPLPAQLLATLRRQLAKPLVLLAHALLLFGRQALELLPALAQKLPLFRRQGAPLLEPLLRSGPLLRRHRQPALAAAREGLLAIRRQAVPFALKALQQLLLGWRERLPGPRRRCRRSRRRNGRFLREARIRGRKEQTQ